MKDSQSCTQDLEDLEELHEECSYDVISHHGPCFDDCPFTSSSPNQNCTSNSTTWYSIMKLVIAGASGFVGTELIRQSLSHPGVSFVIALARREVAIPSDLSSTSDRSKFRSVIVEDYGAFNNDVGEELAGADACIWCA